MGSSAKRALQWLDDRSGFSTNVLPIVRHPVPSNVNWWYVFGSATLVAFIVQVITGVALAFTYVPAADNAYETLQFISHQATLGSIVRGIHYWGASAMVVLVIIHMARIFLMGSYKYPRELNWLTGVGLLFLTLGMAFTGQLLRWDQDAYWAVVVGAEQAGRVPIIGTYLTQILVAGQTVGGATLTRFYATHVFLIPALMFGLIGLHLYLVVRHGISEPPVAGRPVDPASYKAWYQRLLERDGIPFWPDAIWRDVVFAMVIGAVVVVLAMVPGPKELAGRADPTILKAYPRPDWYFLWYFAVLALIPPRIETWIIIGFPAAVVVGLLAIPFVGRSGERSPRRRPWAVGLIAVSFVAVGVLTYEGFQAPWSPDLSPAPLPAAVTQPLNAEQSQGANIFENHGCINCHTIAGSGGRRGPTSAPSAVA
ncbi:MAG: cytochrome bc complex cytochrome b subunit [Thermomicrobiales bacterium]